jgi:hypothetical protein
MELNSRLFPLLPPLFWGSIGAIAFIALIAPSWVWGIVAVKPKVKVSATEAWSVRLVAIFFILGVCYAFWSGKAFPAVP